MPATSLWSIYAKTMQKLAGPSRFQIRNSAKEISTKLLGFFKARASCLGTTRYWLQALASRQVPRAEWVDGGSISASFKVPLATRVFFFMTLPDIVVPYQIRSSRTRYRRPVPEMVQDLIVVGKLNEPLVGEAE